MSTESPNTTGQTLGLCSRATPGIRPMLAVVAALVPVSSGVLVALDAQQSGAADPKLIGAAVAFCVVSVGVAVLAVRRLREVAAVADAVRAAAAPDATPSELAVDASLGTLSMSWNELSQRVCNPDSAGFIAPLTTAGGDALLDALADGVISLDRDGTLRNCNAAASSLLGAESGEITRDVLDEAFDGRIAESIAAVASGGSNQVLTIEAGSEASPQMLRVRVSLFGPGRDRIVVTIADVTRQSVAEASRSGFLAQATHELRSPLTNIKLYTEQAIEEGDDPALRQEALNVISREILRLERTVGDLLQISQLESGTLRGEQADIRVDDMLADVRAAFEAAAQERQITFDLETPPKLPVLRGDRDHVEVLIHNLVGNAIKYTPEGGTVTLRAETDERNFTLEVADTGIGIAPEEAPLVFEKFYRSGDERIRDTEGTGLGLAMAREIARRHGGDITLETELNRGSTFTLRLPTRSAA